MKPSPSPRAILSSTKFLSKTGFLKIHPLLLVLFPILKKNEVAKPGLNQFFVGLIDNLKVTTLPSFISLLFFQSTLSFFSPLLCEVIVWMDNFMISKIFLNLGGPILWFPIVFGTEPISTVSSYCNP